MSHLEINVQQEHLSGGKCLSLKVWMSVLGAMTLEGHCFEENSLVVFLVQLLSSAWLLTGRLDNCLLHGFVAGAALVGASCHSLGSVVNVVLRFPGLT